MYDANRWPHEIQPFDLSDDVEIPTHVLGLVPEPVARENRVLPIGDTPTGLVIAMSNPFDVETVDKLRSFLIGIFALSTLVRTGLTDNSVSAIETMMI